MNGIWKHNMNVPMVNRLQYGFKITHICYSVDMNWNECNVELGKTIQDKIRFSMTTPPWYAKGKINNNYKLIFLKKNLILHKRAGYAPWFKLLGWRLVSHLLNDVNRFCVTLIKINTVEALKIERWTLIQF